MSEASKVKYRRPLNKQQVRTLHLLYWYRFCTAKQLAYSLKKPSPKAIQNKLQILEDQEFISKRYNKSYKLAGRPAEYYITPKGARVLEKAQPNTTNQWATKSLYKNKTVSEDFLKHTVTIVDIVHQLRVIYGTSDTLTTLTKCYTAQYSYYPTWTPDLHLQVHKTATSKTRQHYFLDVWDGTKPFFVTVRKVLSYVKFKEEGDWLDNTPFPTILAICEDKRAQTKLNRQMKRILNDTWDDGLIFATTTKQQLYEATKPTDKIWLKIDMDGYPEKVTLRSLFVTS